MIPHLCKVQEKKNKIYIKLYKDVRTQNYYNHKYLERRRLVVFKIYLIKKFKFQILQKSS